jgi:hypothetical protein
MRASNIDCLLHANNNVVCLYCSAQVKLYMYSAKDIWGSLEDKLKPSYL